MNQSRTGYRLHDRLQADTVSLGMSRLCEVRLMNDSSWPWVILVPAIAGVRLAAIAAGVRYTGRDDLLLVEFAQGTRVAGVLTRSQTPGAPVKWCRKLLPKGQARGFVVVCHPHPQQGGTKDNKVVYMSARAAREAGLASLRFNFRGTGNSEGTYDAGRGEQDDLRAVRDWAVGHSGLELAGLAGFSFGSAAALRVAVADGAPSLVTIGLPTGYFDHEVPRPPGPWLAIYGDADEVIDVARAITTCRELDEPPELVVLET